ncbi:hypothetical protein [Streptomyces sp. LUP30]|uniref:hypothetical protein n=1 Tax=Streptomyces sp. LUP30 TaxID=1890285 RepID=UPI000AFC14A1|nr:hypothetical protein [Streptomyces sp. LUP30]
MPDIVSAVGAAIGPVGLDLLSLTHDAAPVLTLVEATLTLVLFTDAMSVRRRELRLDGFLVNTIGAGTAVMAGRREKRA